MVAIMADPPEHDRLEVLTRDFARMRLCEPGTAFPRIPSEEAGATKLCDLPSELISVSQELVSKCSSGLGVPI